MISSQRASYGSVLTPPGFSVTPFAGQSIFGHRACTLSGRGNQLVKLAYGCLEAPEPFPVPHRKVELTSSQVFALKSQEVVRTAFRAYLVQLLTWYPCIILQQLDVMGKVTVPEGKGGPTGLLDIIVVPVIEELLHRAIIQGSLKGLLTASGVNPSRAKNVSHTVAGLAFALPHGFNSGNFLLTHVITRLPLGYYLGKIYEEHGLSCAIATHILINFIIGKVECMIFDEANLNSAAGLTLLGAYVLLGSGLVKITSSDITSDETPDYCRHSGIVFYKFPVSVHPEALCFLST